jgi:type IV secretion system protein VirB2
MKSIKTLPLHSIVLAAGALFVLAPNAAFAAGGFGGGTLPWLGPLQQVQQLLSGPIAVSISTILLIFLGFLIAFGEMRGFLGLFLRVSFGLSLVFAAASWLSSFGFG